MNSLPADVLRDPCELAGAESDAFLKRVLAAEDDPLYSRVLQRFLGERGFKVQCVSDGLEAFDKARLPGAPRILVLDWVMPGMHGPEICRRLREHPAPGGYQYILLLSANDKKADVVAGLEAGADDYLTKPFDVYELLARIRAGMRMVRLQNNLYAAQERLRFQATHDPLTGVWNRGALLDLLQSELGRAGRKGSSVAVFMLDIDHFKKINDIHGHLTGDAVLHEVAQRLAQTVRGYDVIGRYGGEEFVVAAELEPAQALDYAERLRQCVRATPIAASGGSVTVSVSVGVSLAHPVGECDFRLPLQAADDAMYTAKRKGRDRVEAAGNAAAPS
jgi:diguanylate cyclase (GGDEF)-like protein